MIVLAATYGMANEIYVLSSSLQNELTGSITRVLYVSEYGIEIS